MTDDLYADPFADESLEDDETLYRLTGKGLHAIGAIDANALEYFERIEQERDDARELLADYDEIITFLMTQLNHIADAITVDDACGLAEEALLNVTQVRHG